MARDIQPTDLIGKYLATDLCHAAGRLAGLISCGQSLSPDELGTILFHLRVILDSKRVNKDNPYEILIQLSDLTRKESQKSPLFSIRPEWCGDTVESISPARPLLESFWHCADAADQEQTKELLSFYYGEQWPTEIALKRQREGRPHLTVNRLQSLVAAAIEKERLRGQPPLSERETHALILAVTARNMDAQRVYNYMVSAVMELIGEQFEMAGKVIAKATGGGEESE